MRVFGYRFFFISRLGVFFLFPFLKIIFNLLDLRFHLSCLSMANDFFTPDDVPSCLFEKKEIYVYLFRRREDCGFWVGRYCSDLVK